MQIVAVAVARVDSFEPVLERELLRLIVLGESLADLGDPLAGPGPPRRRGLLLLDVEEGDGLDVERRRVVGLPPELLGDDGAVGEAAPGAVALVGLLQLDGRLVELHQGPRREVLQDGPLRRGHRRGVALPPGGALLLLQGERPRPSAVDAAAPGGVGGDVRLVRGGRLPVLEAERALEAAAARHLVAGLGRWAGAAGLAGHPR
uniref:EDA39 n=1 Tax=Arundo donax TaxID=35708 RepID=A0A0A8ZKZ6_ARUDO